MRVEAPALLPILRSRLQGVVLAACYLQPEREFSVTELAGVAGATAKATGQEVHRLVATGYLTDRRQGNLRLVRRPQPNLIVKPLTDLLAVTFGPLPVLAAHLKNIPNLQEAFIYGSWAARYENNAGPLPGDVDVLVVGDPPADMLDEVAIKTSRELLRPVNIRRAAAAYWENPPAADSFVRTVKAGPLVRLPIGGKAEELA